MKRVLKIAFIAGLAMLLFPGLTGAQGKKEQKKIKIVVSDNGASRVLVDTTFTGKMIPDSITLKDGQVICITKNSDVLADNDNDIDNDISVNIISDGKGEKKITREITVISGDSVNMEKSEKGKRLYYYYNDRKDGHKEDGQKFNIELNSDEPDGDIEKQSYVIAKDGMVVTIEGGSEEKVKELAGFIESKLGISKGDKAVKQSVTKEETRKEVKK